MGQVDSGAANGERLLHRAQALSPIAVRRHEGPVPSGVRRANPVRGWVGLRVERRVHWPMASMKAGSRTRSAEGAEGEGRPERREAGSSGGRGEGGGDGSSSGGWNRVEAVGVSARTGTGTSKRARGRYPPLAPPLGGAGKYPCPSPHLVNYPLLHAVAPWGDCLPGGVAVFILEDCWWELQFVESIASSPVMWEGGFPGPLSPGAPRPTGSRSAAGGDWRLRDVAT